MKGYGVSYGAISVLNAIPCGIGSSIGIRLKVESFFEESDATEIELVGHGDMDDSLASMCVWRTLEKLNRKPNGFTLTIKSEIPPSVGLKSSSAVCNATILSVLDYYKEHWNPFDVIDLGVECSKKCGVTVTGSFDDACCSMFGGLVVADNRNNTLIFQKNIADYEVAIFVPNYRIEKKDVVAERYRCFSDLYGELIPFIEKHYLSVMKENGRCVSEIIGDSTLLDRATRVPALAAGITGTGPAVTVVADGWDNDKHTKVLGCDTIVTKVRNTQFFNLKKVNGFASLPASKSITHRALFMAALSRKTCIIDNPLISGDIDSTIGALETMGVRTVAKGGRYIVESKDLHVRGWPLDVGNSGTTLRFMTALAATLDGTTVITGDESLCNRPVGPLLDALGVKGPNTGKPPVTVTGPIKKDRFVIDGSMSSQFVSALLMIAPTMGMPVDIDVVGRRVSQPYIDMTVSMMERFGIMVEKTDKGYHVEPGEYIGFDYTVPNDFSSAAYMLVAGALGGRVLVGGLDPDGIQGDKSILDILRKAGCRVTIEDGVVISEKNGRPKATDVDMTDTPDLFPIVAVLLSVADGKSRLYGAPHLKYKESNRIETTAEMLNSIGAKITPADDGCIIEGVPRLKGGWIEHRGDHRVMMAAAIASVISEGPVFMDSDHCWNVSFTGFNESFRRLER